MVELKSALEFVREDDFVEYFIFPTSTRSLSSEASSSDHSSITHNNLSETLKLVLSVVNQHSSSYIWHKDEINFRLCSGTSQTSLQPQNEPEEKLPPHLYGVTHYGDNIEDEWFIVFLLLKATQTIPGVVVRVADSDGEFLLIEAANHLPQWATPDSCNRRVYLYDGAVHLVPGEENSTVAKAIEAVCSQPDSTRASPAIQSAINSRINKYPEGIADTLHHANVMVPIGVAALLNERPSLVAPAVVAFSHRDPIDLKVCRAMRYFPPENCVMTRVVFTKCLYAMLLHQKYNPDRRTGWVIPASTDPSYLASILGVKLACGFEILMSQNKNNETFGHEQDWDCYKKALINKGYFKGLLEGSEEYKVLEQKAQKYHSSYAHISKCSQPSTGQIVRDLLSEVNLDEIKLRQEKAALLPPDDDSWLDVTPTELDEMMQQRYGCVPSHPSKDISSKLASFLNHVTSVEGAEYPQDGTSEDVPVRPQRGIKQKKKNKGGETNKPCVGKDDPDNSITFDHEAFSCAVKSMLDFVIPEDNWDMESDGSEMSSYDDEEGLELGSKTNDSSATPVSELKQYMDQLDRELSSTTIGKSFEKVTDKGMDDSFSEVENFNPVDIDMNALKNVLESYQAQMGDAGPASNLLGPMGVNLGLP